MKDLQEERDRSASETRELERKLRDLSERNRELQEELDESRDHIATQERECQRRIEEIETKHASLQRSFDQLRDDLDSRASLLQVTQQKLAETEAEASELRNEAFQLKSHTGDSTETAVLKREFSEQTANIKKLEATNREQRAELQRFRERQKAIQVVEEEKRVLEGKVRMMEDLRRQLSEAQLRRQILEDERASWASYLEGQDEAQGDLQFDSPEEMARAFMRTRLENASLTERLGALQPELRTKDDAIASLEDSRAKLLAEMEQLKKSGANPLLGENKARARLERQKNLAVKEVEYLRAQLKALDAEQAENEPDRYDAEKTAQIQRLEGLLDEHRAEIEGLRREMASLEDRAAPASPSAGSKRPREGEDDERLGELHRKNHNLQEEVATLRSRNAVLESEMKAQAHQLSSLRRSSRTRILELSDNPTAQAEAIKMSTLRTLRAENRALLSALEARFDANAADAPKMVPQASLDAIRDELSAVTAEVAQKEKRNLRRMQIYTAKAGEFREAVASLLGWKLDFMPNGRVKVTSMFYPGDEEQGQENSIVFDGENGTMKVSGGPRSEFAREIRSLVEFWVEGRKEIPCLLAAMTLEFYERTTRAAA